MSRLKNLSKRMKSIESVHRVKNESIWDAFERAPDNLETTQDCYFYLIDQGFTLEDINGSLQKREDEERAARLKNQEPLEI